MSEAAVAAVSGLFLVFCRVAGCLMILPGFSSPQLPVRVRLLLAIACSLALAPAVLPQVMPVVQKPSASLPYVILSEVFSGLTIGFAGRIIFTALEFMGTAMASFLSLGATPGIPLEDHEPGTLLATPLTLTATVLVFLADLHHEALRALVSSYAILPVSGGVAAGMALDQVATVASQAFRMTLQLGSPFLVYSILVNLMFAFANKLLPQVPLYFVSVPFVVLGGLVLLAWMAPEILAGFSDFYAAWLVQGGA